MIMSAQSIRAYCTQPEFPLITPFHEKTIRNGMTFGLGACGYDIRITETITLLPGSFALGSSMERFMLPRALMGVVHDKSTWARLGLAVQNTVLEPNWEGFLTIELSNHSDVPIMIWEGSPIAQVVFHRLDAPTELPYKGKYQNQAAGVQVAIMETDDQPEEN